jgi:dipeptidyl aminopeptidase/acylaminoacyl peptidase
MIRNFRLASLLIGILIAISTSAFAGDLAPPDAYSTISKIRNVAISPSGNYVAYQRTEDAENQILVLNMSSGELVFHTSLFKKSYLHTVQFVSDRYVMISFDTRGRGPSAGRRTEFIDLDERKIQKNFIAKAPIDVVGIASDLDAIYTPWDIGSLTRYFVANGKRSPSLASGSSDTINWFMSKDGKPLVRVDFDPDESRHVVYAYHDNEPSIIVDEHYPSMDIAVLALMPQQDSLIYLTRLPGVDRMTLHTMSLADGSRSDPVFSGFGGAVLADSGQTAFGFGRDEFPGYEYEFLNQQAESHFRSIEKSLPGMRVELVASTDDFQHMVVRAYQHWGTSHYLFFKAGSPRPVVIDKESSGVSGDQAMPRKMFEFAASDGRTIRAYLTLPAGTEPEGSSPLIVLSSAHFHDEPRQFQWLAQYLASRGHTVVQPLIRGASYDWPFMPQGDLNWGGKLESDIDETVQYLVDQGTVDPSQVCVIGFGTGGYAALASAARAPKDYRCVASIGGATKLDDFFQRARKQSNRYPQKLRYLETRYGVAGTDKESIKELSPGYQVDVDFPPTLLMYFEKGDFLYKDQAVDMQQELEGKKRNVTLREIPGYDFRHSEREARKQVLEAVSGLIEEHL